jgi:hypothetical protein
MLNFVSETYGMDVGMEQIRYWVACELILLGLGDKEQVHTCKSHLTYQISIRQIGIQLTQSTLNPDGRAPEPEAAQLFLPGANHCFRCTNHAAVSPVPQPG